MDVFVTGATGFIGGAVARRLQQVGHHVVGLARSDTAAATLRQQGIDVHRGDLTDVTSLATATQRADAVVHAGAAQHAGMDRGEIDRRAVHAMVAVLEGTHKPFLYTSDQLIYGSTGDTVADEHTPLNPPPFIAWRAALEQDVLAAVARGVHAMVVRPVAVYGHNRGGIAMFVAQAQQQGAAYYIDQGDARWSTVHVDDLADLYVRMLENAPAGTLLCAAAQPSVSMKELMTAIGRAAGVEARSLTRDQARNVMGPLVPVDGFATNLQVSAAQAMALLGWQPRMPSVLDELAKLTPSQVQTA